MRSELHAGGPRAASREDHRTAIEQMATEWLRGDERIVACLPFVHVPKLAKGSAKLATGSAKKVKDGIHQSYRRFRPLVLTDRRLLVFDTARTPHPRGVLAVFPRDEVEVLAVRPARFGGVEVELELPGTGTVPFVAGRKDRDGLIVMVHELGGAMPAA